MEKVIYFILILNIFASVGKSAPTAKSIFTQIPIDKCPKLGILNNASLPYFIPCRNAQLTNLPTELGLFTIGDYLCFGIYDAELKLCSILTEKYEKIPVSFEDLEKQLGAIEKLPTEEFCLNFRKVNEKVTIHEHGLEDTLKVFYLSIRGNDCTKVCSDFTGKVNKLCLILYLINSYNYELSTPNIEHSKSATTQNNVDKNKSLSRGAITNTGESNTEVENVGVIQQNQEEEALLAKSPKSTTQQTHETGVETLEEDIKHVKPEQQNTGLSEKSVQSGNSNHKVERVQLNHGYVEGNHALVRGNSGAEIQRPVSSLAQTSLVDKNHELPGEGSIISARGDNVVSNFEMQHKKDPQSVKLILTSGRHNSVPGEQSPLTGAQNPASGGERPVSGSQSPASGGQSPASSKQSPASSKQSPALGGQSPVSGGQNPVSGGQNPVSGGQNPVSGRQNPVSDGQNPVSGDHIHVSDDQNPESNGQNPASNGQNSASNGQNPASNGQNHVSGGQSPSSDVPVGNKSVPSPNSGTPVDNSKLPPENHSPPQKDDKSPTIPPSTVSKPSTVKEETTEFIVDDAKKSDTLDPTSIQNEQNIDLDQDQKEEEIEENGPVPPKTRDYTDDEDPGQMDEKETVRVAAEELSQSVSMKNFPEDEDSNFFSYFMFISVMFIAGYVIYHNKQKILALLLEGRRDRNSRRRPNTASYRKLNSNLEEAVTSKCSNSASHVIY